MSNSHQNIFFSNFVLLFVFARQITNFNTLALIFLSLISYSSLQNKKYSLQNQFNLLSFFLRKEKKYLYKFLFLFLKEEKIWKLNIKDSYRYFIFINNIDI